MTSRQIAILGSSLITPNKLQGLAAWYDASDASTVLTQVGGATAFASASSQFLSVAGNASLSISNTASFTWAGWLYYDNTLSVTYTPISVATGTGTRNSRIYRYGTSAAIQVMNVQVFWGGTVAAGWHFVVGWYDHTTGKLNIQIDDGIVSTSIASVGTESSNGVFSLGQMNGADYYNGKLDEYGIWGRTLTASERTWLYNSGAGRTYSEADASLKTNLVSWWSMNAPASGDWQDQHGSNHLTPNASRPTATDGVTFRQAADTETVRRWMDKSATGAHWNQPLLVNQPTLSGGKVVGDGVNSYMTATFPAIAQPYTVMFVAKNTAALPTNLANYIYETSSRSQVFVANIHFTIGYAIRSETYPVDATWMLSSLQNETVVISAVLAGASSIQQKGTSIVKTNNIGTIGITADEVVLMARASSSSYSGKFTGSISEIAFWSGALTNAQINNMMRYFARKWGVSL